jgi:ribosome-binding ATPase YchF (GTP1/OBG family)
VQIEDEQVRAWPARHGALAPTVAGKIHSELQKGFIRAEVIHYDELVRVGSLPAARSQGVLRLERKQSVVQDGDILHVRHA